MALPSGATLKRTVISRTILTGSNPTCADRRSRPDRCWHVNAVRHDADVFSARKTAIIGPRAQITRPRAAGTMLLVEAPPTCIGSSQQEGIDHAAHLTIQSTVTDSHRDLQGRPAGMRATDRSAIAEMVCGALMPRRRSSHATGTNTNQSRTSDGAFTTATSSDTMWRAPEVRTIDSSDRPGDRAAVRRGRLSGADALVGCRRTSGRRVGLADQPRQKVPFGTAMNQDGNSKQ